MATQMKQANLITKGDSKIAINSVMEKTKAPNQITNLIIMTLANEIMNIKFSYCHRTVNKLADRKAHKCILKMSYFVLKLIYLLLLVFKKIVKYEKVLSC